ncbi:Putative MoaB/Mog domain-containing protein [Septoria linicola]|uniref:MoaB/Mog domain-containing protein n=1 Tax=Septoria linicola TaxID=215465 RepID=A0A9Q9B6C9_9PEZI|nr:putative MoaB/Mog domain-containing protein [Septoria linicola]USW57146.1 Putative MoaB/Mog domain-containing protein [Septoria linicola]
MFSRVSQLTRHLSRPLPNYLHNSAASTTTSFLTSRAMAAERSKRQIHTAACLIIGDEVLGGKTVDTNSAWFAKYCFSLGIALQRVEVIADDESEIIEAARRMSSNYDFVITSGGIGPTHDDITYQSIARAFHLPLVLHEEAFKKMKSLSRPHPSQKDFSWEVDSPARRAKMRMIQLPYDKELKDEDQVIFTAEDLWVPISVVNGNVHILPGIPRLFEKMLTGLKPRILPRLVDPEGKGVHRILFSTPLAESEVADFLTQLSEKVESKGVKVGSYPRWGKSRNTVTLVGKDKEFMETLVQEVEKGVEGRRIQVEGEDDDAGSDKDT